MHVVVTVEVDQLLSCDQSIWKREKMNGMSVQLLWDEKKDWSMRVVKRITVSCDEWKLDQRQEDDQMMMMMMMMMTCDFLTIGALWPIHVQIVLITHVTEYSLVLFTQNTQG